METKVINIKSGQPYDVYIGRDYKQYKNQGWGNPFPEWKYGREECIKMYEEKYLNLLANEALHNRHTLRDKILTLKGKTLGCWCHPLPCHGNILIKLIGELDGHS